MRPPDSDKVLQTWADVVWRQGERFGTIGRAKERRYRRSNYAPF